MNTLKANVSDIDVLGDMLLVKVHEISDETEEGIIIPEAAKQAQTQFSGEVVKVGPGRWASVLPDQPASPVRIPMSIREGDTVVFNRHGGFEVKINDEPYLLLKEAEIAFRISPHTQIAAEG